MLWLLLDPLRLPDVRLARRALLTGASQLVEVWERWVPASDPVGRASPGTALVRLVRGLEAPLRLDHRTSLGRDTTWYQPNRVALAYVDGIKVTVDGGVVDIKGNEVRSVLAAPAREWAAVTVAFDGHLPADVQSCLRLFE